MDNTTTRREYEALKSDLTSLRSDVSSLIQTLLSGGREKAMSVKESTAEEAQRRLRQIGDSVGAARQRSQDAYRQAEQQVAEHPVVALLSAIGLGFLIGVLITWRRSG